MAYSPDGFPLGPQPGGHFGGDNHTPYRCFIWDTGANIGKPIMPANNVISGVAGSDGKAFVFATPGVRTTITCRFGGAAGPFFQIVAGNLYSVDTSGRILATLSGTSSGSVVRALESFTHADGSPADIEKEFEIWKPKG